MTRQLSRYGEGKLGCIIWLLVLGAVVLVAAKLIPVKIRSAELYDFMEEQAMFAARTSPEEIKKRILGRAEELELPLDKKNLSVARKAGRVRMRATYTVPIELPFYTFEWPFEHIIDRPVFIV